MRASDCHDAAALHPPLDCIVHLMTDSKELEELVQVLPAMVGSLLPLLGSSVGQALKKHHLKQRAWLC